MRSAQAALSWQQSHNAKLANRLEHLQGLLTGPEGWAEPHSYVTDENIAMYFSVPVFVLSTPIGK